MKFEEDFDFETANAQFNKEEIDKEFQSKLKLKGTRAGISSDCIQLFQRPSPYLTGPSCLSEKYYQNNMILTIARTLLLYFWQHLY